MKPIYLLNVDAMAANALVLIVRTDNAGDTTGQIKLPLW